MVSAALRTPVHEVICANCGCATPEAHAGGPAPGCQSCGAPLRALEPLVVQCGWCQASNRRDQTATCGRCGGPLPALPGGDPGPRPPQVPRVLPQGYRWRTLLWKNIHSMIGASFVVLFFWTLLLPLIGLPLWYFGHRKGKRWLLALQTGRATRARLTRIELDVKQSINHQHPWRIEYGFDLHEGDTGQGYCEAWDEINGKRQVGDALWVVYARDDEGYLASAIWPPLR
jgi:hypothetical protein